MKKHLKKMKKFIYENYHVNLLIIFIVILNDVNAQIVIKKMISRDIM